MHLVYHLCSSTVVYPFSTSTCSSLIRIAMGDSLEGQFSNRNDGQKGVVLLLWNVLSRQRRRHGLYTDKNTINEGQSCCIEEAR